MAVDLGVTSQESYGDRSRPPATVEVPPVPTAACSMTPAEQAHLLLLRKAAQDQAVLENVDGRSGDRGHNSRLPRPAGRNEEDAALAWLAELGYEVRYGFDLGPARFPFTRDAVCAYGCANLSQAAELGAMRARPGTDENPGPDNKKTAGAGFLRMARGRLELPTLGL